MTPFPPPPDRLAHGNGAPPEGVQILIYAPTVEDALSEFLPEAPEAAPPRIIHIVPATYLSDPTPAASPYDERTSRRIRTGTVVVFVAMTVTVLRGSVGRTIRLMYATAHMGWVRARMFTRIRARSASSRLSGISDNLTRAWRAARLCCSVAGTQGVPGMITPLQAIATATITSTQHVGAVARVHRDSVARRFAALLQSVGIRRPAWREGIGRIYAPMLNSRLASFGGGIAIGAILMWTFDLPPRTSTITVQQGLVADDTPPSLDVLGSATQVLGLSRQDLPRESGLRMVSAVPVTTPVGAGSVYPERRQTMTRPPAAEARPAVATRRMAGSPVPRFRGTLAIDSVAKGARIFINGQPVGATPLRLKDVPVGSRAVRVEAAGYHPWSASVQVTANQQTHVIAKLERLRAAALK